MRRVGHGRLVHYRKPAVGYNLPMDDISEPVPYMTYTPDDVFDVILEDNFDKTKQNKELIRR